MTALMVVSLVVIGLVTIDFFQTENYKYHQERLVRKERAIKTEMQYFSKEVELQGNTDVVIQTFEEEVLRLATVHNLEINVFNTKGQMLVSASPDTIHTEYLDRRVPPIALEQLSLTDRIVLPETRSERNYLSDYTLLRNSKGDRIAILNLPYERAQSLDQNDLNDFLGSIGLTYAFMFLAAIGMTIFLSNSITKNLAVLSDRMESVDFAAANKPIEWKRDDEVGKLVATYNTMLEKLAESREMLARTEREGAWREMARQVAHEIKNPLTPIKLSVQHLQATSSFDEREWREKFQKTMAMIINQIESLNKIASDFSAFAQMPKAAQENVNLATALADVQILFSDFNVPIEIKLSEELVQVWIDPDAFRRVLGNLVQNAIYAVSGMANPLILIRVQSAENKVVLEIEDNGTGIPKELESKIFQPNFTTKSSGTGLGLAICQQIIEQANGKIWFDSEEGKGTKFTIELPKTA
jgi:two-component system, NtrC family, nitrogen regulation sensor histidine kinase NtrY